MKASQALDASSILVARSSLSYGLVKRIFAAFCILPLFFLTSCASQRYDNSRVSAPAAAQNLSFPLDFSWPLEGRLRVSYGQREDGVSSKGVVLDASEGQPVRAAEAGQVVYVSENLRGYGRTVILEHGSGFSTVYARAAEILVRSGQRVKKGEAVARAGLSGRGESPQVYFEIRQYSKPQNPVNFLR